jgi:hypothetical protein
VQFGLGAVLQHFANPTSLFEHEHEDDFDAPGEHLQPATRVQFGPGAGLKHFATSAPLFEHEDEHEHEHDFDAPGEGGVISGR